MKGSAAGEYSEKFHVHDVYLCGDINVTVNRILFYLISSRCICVAFIEVNNYNSGLLQK